MEKNFVDSNKDYSAGLKNHNSSMSEDKSIFILQFKEAQRFFIDPLTVSQAKEVDKLGSLTHTTYPVYYEYNRLESLVSKIRFLGWKNNLTGCSMTFSANIIQHAVVVSHETEHPKTHQVLKVYSINDFNAEIIEKHLTEWVEQLRKNHGEC